MCVYILGSETQNFLHEIQRFFIHRESERNKKEKDGVFSLLLFFFWVWFPLMFLQKELRERVMESLQRKRLEVRSERNKKNVFNLVI